MNLAHRRVSLSAAPGEAIVRQLPDRAGWYRLELAGLPDCETLDLELDFGLGFVGWHSLRIFPKASEATLFVRMFKPPRALRLPRLGAHKEGATISFQRLSRLAVLRRRAAEQIWLALRFLRHAARLSGESRHDQPRRLWKWRGLQAFPVGLPATGESSYAQWRRVTAGLRSQVPTAVKPDWLIVMDLRAAKPELGAVAACAMAAEHAGASLRIVIQPDDPRIREQVAELVPETCVIACNAGDASLLAHLEPHRFRWAVQVPPRVSLDPHCVTQMAAAAQNASVAVIFADNDHADSRGRRSRPEFRSTFSPERLKHQDWLGPVLALRLDALAHAGGWPEEEGDSHKVCLEILHTSGQGAFAHVPDILYACRVPPHRRSAGGAAASQNGSSARSARLTGAQGDWGAKTTIIVPTRNRADLLDRCISSILKATSSHGAEIIIHDNGSDEPESLRLLQRLSQSMRVIRDELPFNYSRINNDAAAIARGELLVFLNNDAEVLSADWLDVLGPIAADGEVGAVGPLLLDSRGRIQHAGIVTGPGGIAAHVHEGVRPDDCDPLVPLVRRDVSAVTGACMVVEKKKFLSAGGFDARGLAVAFNDVDLCLRLERMGYRNIFVPEVTLVHQGSATREADDFVRGADRFREEFQLMRSRWGVRLDVDPYLPRHMHLSGSVPQLRLA